jgi:di/tricarboxylate transporter
MKSFRSTIISLVVFGALLTPLFVSAAAFENPLGRTSIQGLITMLLTVLVRIGAVLCVFFLILSGFNFVVAQGNPGEIKKAKDMFKWTIIGGLITMGAFAISEVIKNTLCSILPAAC